MTGIARLQTIRPELPRWVVERRGRLFILLALSLIFLAIEFTAKETFGTTNALTGRAQLYLVLEVALGAVWAVLDDRTTERGWTAALRGLALCLFASRMPGFIFFGFFPHRFAVYQITNELDCIVAGFAVLAFLGTSTRGRETEASQSLRLPIWLATSGGRFALLSLVACLSLLEKGVNSALEHETPYAMNWPAHFIAVFWWVSSVGTTVLWAVADDRRTEQPWRAMARGAALHFCTTFLGTISSGILPRQASKAYELLSSPQSRPLAWRLLRFTPVTLMALGVAAMIFIFLPIPRQIATNTSVGATC